jgi:hypothetical protein
MNSLIGLSFSLLLHKYPFSNSSLLQVPELSSSFSNPLTTQFSTCLLTRKVIICSGLRHTTLLPCRRRHPWRSLQWVTLQLIVSGYCLPTWHTPFHEPDHLSKVCQSSFSFAPDYLARVTATYTWRPGPWPRPRRMGRTPRSPRWCRTHSPPWSGTCTWVHVHRLIRSRKHHLPDK